MTTNLTDLQFKVLNHYAHHEMGPTNGATPECIEDTGSYLWPDDAAKELGLTGQQLGGVLSSLVNAGLAEVEAPWQHNKDGLFTFTEAGFEAWRAHYNQSTPRSSKWQNTLRRVLEGGHPETYLLPEREVLGIPVGVTLGRAVNHDLRGVTEADVEALGYQAMDAHDMQGVRVRIFIEVKDPEGRYRAPQVGDRVLNLHKRPGGTWVASVRRLVTGGKFSLAADARCEAGAAEQCARSALMGQVGWGVVHVLVPADEVQPRGARRWGTRYLMTPAPEWDFSTASITEALVTEALRFWQGEV